MENIAGSIAMLLLGASITLVGQYVKNLSERDTHASNKIFEVRLAALDSIWEKFSNALFEVSPAMTLGYDQWKETHFERAEKLRYEFRGEVKKRQIVLDHRVIQGFWKLDTDIMLFSSGELRDKNNKPVGYAEYYETKLQPNLQSLATTINETMDVSTHTIALRF